MLVLLTTGESFNVNLVFKIRDQSRYPFHLYCGNHFHNPEVRLPCAAELSVYYVVGLAIFERTLLVYFNKRTIFHLQVSVFVCLATGVHVEALRERISYGLISGEVLRCLEVLFNGPKINICDVFIQLLVNRLCHE